MTIAPQITPAELKRAHAMRDQGQGWPKVAMYFGLGIEQLRRQMDPDWQARRNAGWMASKKTRVYEGRDGGKRGIATAERAPAHVLAERERCMAYEPTPNMVILGDPAPTRSALYQSRFAQREFRPLQMRDIPFGLPSDDGSISGEAS